MKNLRVYQFLLREGYPHEDILDILIGRAHLNSLRTDFNIKREDYRQLVAGAEREGGLIEQCDEIIDEIDKLLKELSTSTHLVTVEGLPVYIKIHNAGELTPLDLERLKETIANDISLCLQDYFPPRRESDEIDKEIH